MGVHSGRRLTEWDADGELNPVETPMFKMQVEKEIAKETETNYSES